MTRRMSCSLTIDAVRERRKTVTRRAEQTWQRLAPGDRLTLVEKAMGLPKGVRQVVLAEVEIVSVRIEALCQITAEECANEGFPELTPDQFIAFWLQGHRPNHGANTVVRRIEWRYVL